MVYFDDLNWRSAGTVGHDSLYLFENDTGPDDSVHSMMGIFIMYDPSKNMHSKVLKNAKWKTWRRRSSRCSELRDEEGMDGHVLSEVVS